MAFPSTPSWFLPFLSLPPIFPLGVSLGSFVLFFRLAFSLGVAGSGRGRLGLAGLVPRLAVGHVQAQGRTNAYKMARCGWRMYFLTSAQRRLRTTMCGAEDKTGPTRI